MNCLLIFQVLAIIPLSSPPSTWPTLCSYKLKRTLPPPDREDNRCSTLPAWSGAINHSSAINEWDLLSGAREGKNRNTSYLIKRKSTDWQWLRGSFYSNGSRLYYSFGALLDIFRETVGNMTLLMFKWKTDCAFFPWQKYLLPILAHCCCFYPLEGTWSH